MWSGMKTASASPPLADRRRAIQNTYFSASCVFRTSFVLPVIVPNEPLVGSVTGLLQLGWFRGYHCEIAGMEFGRVGVDADHRSQSV
jgi:hypothetical protein